MIDTNYSDAESDIGPVFVLSPTGLLVGVYWGTRHDICEAIDEVTDPNECQYRRCEPGGIQLGCYRGEEEISVAAYNTARDSELDEHEVRVEAFSDSVADWCDSTDQDWLPIVPPGYMYSAGTGLTKIDADWN